MIVFKSYFKLIYQRKWIILMSFFIFLFISVAFVQSSTSDPGAIKINVAVINEGADEAIFEGLKTQLGKTTTLVEPRDTDIQSIKQSLFFRKIDYVAYVQPDLTVKTLTVPNSSFGFLMDQMIDSYMNTVNTYKSTSLDTNTAIQFTLDDLSTSITLNFNSTQTTLVNESNLMKYFNFYVYGLVGVILTSITSVVIAFNDPLVFNRSSVSSMSVKTRNMYLFLSHIVLGIGVWIIFAIPSAILYQDLAFSGQHWMYLINSFIFIFPITSMSFLVASFVKSRSAITGVNNVISLGLSFISGAFIPSYLLSPLVLSIAGFFPAYWYIQANELILANKVFDLSVIQNQILIQILFGIAYISVALALSKQKSMNRDISTKLA